MKKPWIEDKRSWIFYLKQIEQDEDAVQGETEHTVYVFDCETAHLFVWVKQLDTFTEVGVSNLLKRLNGRWEEDIDGEEILFGTRILYKGIELQERYRSNDAEILEYIDIKQELKRKYININRKNFTFEGIGYFEKEIYPALIEAIREALHHMEDEARWKRTETFYEKIGRILHKKCLELREEFPEYKWRELLNKVTWSGFSREQLDIMYPVIELVATASVLSYYAERGEWNIWDQVYTPNGQKESIWHKVVYQINQILSRDGYVLELLGKASILFRISTIDAQLNESVVRMEERRGKRITCFHELFLPETHFAIQQYRTDENSLWGLRLILLQDKKDQRSKRYEDISRIPRVNAEKLEQWGNDFCNINQIFMDGEEHSQHLLLKWLLKNIPTIGMFSDARGNVRVNVLGARIMPSIFMNQNFKKLIIKRILETAQSDSIERFSTISWQNTEYINCLELPFNIYFVSRGCYSSYSCHKCVIPLKRDWFMYWIEECEKRGDDDNTRVLDFIDSLDIKECFNKVDFRHIVEELKKEDIDEEEFRNLRNIALYLERGYKKNSFFTETAPVLLDGVISKLMDENYKPGCTLEQLLEKRNGWDELYAVTIKVGFLGRIHAEKLIEKYIKQMKYMAAFEEVCCAWYYCFFRKREILDRCSKTRRIYQEFCKKNPTIIQERKRIVLYLKNTLDNRNAEKIEMLIQQYETEILQLMMEEEIKLVNDSMDMLLLKYKYLEDKLKNSEGADR